MKLLTKLALAVALNFQLTGLVSVKLSKTLPVCADTICRQQVSFTETFPCKCSTDLNARGSDCGSWQTYQGAT